MKAVSLKKSSKQSKHTLQSAATAAKQADHDAKAANQRLHLAKAKLKAARKVFKQAKKAAKKAAKQARRVQVELQAALDKAVAKRKKSASAKRKPVAKPARSGKKPTPPRQARKRVRKTRLLVSAKKTLETGAAPRAQPQEPVSAVHSDDGQSGREPEMG